jgi:hypothetical protein
VDPARNSDGSNEGDEGGGWRGGSSQAGACVGPGRGWATPVTREA